MRYGAKPEEWDLFCELGLIEDLLPVVSNPTLELSPNSKIKTRGKLPSLVNKNGLVVGIKKWTSKRATFAEVEKWRSNPDYGCCIISRNIRALDIDVEDPDKAASIGVFIVEHLGGLFLPYRSRKNSGKFLLAFRMQGDFQKLSFKLDGGAIEFLANNQEFVAAGTHTSGARYEWEWNNLGDFPVLTEQQFSQLWAALIDKYGKGGAHRSLTTRGKGTHTGGDIIDPYVDKLDILGEGPNGILFITCPWKSEHTTESGDSETTYMPRGTGRGGQQYELGHFKCLHAHCENRTDDDFIKALHLHDDDFEQLPATIEDETTELDNLRGRFKTNKAGEILATINNILIALNEAGFCNWHIARDEFRDEIMIQKYGDAAAWVGIVDEDQTEIQRILEWKGFKPISTDTMRRAIQHAARSNKFDSAITWLESLTWDGVPRIKDFLPVYFGASASDYATAVSLYMWTALAGRVLSPGCKADMVPVLQGPEGIRKSSAVAALSPSPEYFAELNFEEKEDDIARKMRGKLIFEISELRGLNTKEREHILAFIVRQYEKWTPKYKEHQATLSRRCIFFGTTNDGNFLSEDGRRWLPFHVDLAHPELIERDRNQLWAEARELFGAHGVMYQDAERLGKLARSDFIYINPLEQVIIDWLHEDDDVSGTKNIDREYISVAEIRTMALQLDIKNYKDHDDKKVTRIFKKLGYTPKLIKRNKRTFRAWVKDIV